VVEGAEAEAANKGAPRHRRSQCWRQDLAGECGQKWKTCPLLFQKRCSRIYRAFYIPNQCAGTVENRVAASVMPTGEYHPQYPSISVSRIFGISLPVGVLQNYWTVKEMVRLVPAVPVAD
jgi:hypothetical protein